MKLGTKEVSQLLWAAVCPPRVHTGKLSCPGPGRGDTWPQTVTPPVRSSSRSPLGVWMRQSKRAREVGVCVRRPRNLSETGQSSLGTESTGQLEIILHTSILSLSIQVYY